MMGIIHRLHAALDMIKGFTPGYSSNNNKQMIVNIDGANYKLTLEKLNEGQLTFDVIKEEL